MNRVHILAGGFCQGTAAVGKLENSATIHYLQADLQMLKPSWGHYCCRNETPAAFCWWKPTLGEIYFNDVQLQKQTGGTVSRLCVQSGFFSLLISAEATRNLLTCDFPCSLILCNQEITKTISLKETTALLLLAFIWPLMLDSRRSPSPGTRILALKDAVNAAAARVCLRELTVSVLVACKWRRCVPQQRDQNQLEEETRSPFAGGFTQILKQRSGFLSLLCQDSLSQHRDCVPSCEHQHPDPVSQVWQRKRGFD